MTQSPNPMLIETPGICGGRVRLDGTRITVHRLATLHRQGQNAEEIGDTYPQLSPAQINTALAYYYAHQETIDAELAAADAEYDQLRQEFLGKE